MPATRSLRTLALVVLIVLAGCSGGAGDAAGGGDAGLSAQGEAATAAAEEAQEGDAASAGGAGGGEKGAEFQVARTNRALIRTGEITLRVDDFESARANLTAMVRASGGFVSDSHQVTEEIDNETYTRGTVVLRVPADNFSTFFEAVAAEGNVVESSTNTKDVTEQLVDIQARLKNLRAQRARLREMYENANDTEDVLAVSRRLSEVQGEIERLQARQRSLERQVALATITVHLREPRPEPDFEPPERWYDTPVLKAFLESVDGAVLALRAVVVGFAFVLPYLLVFGVPLALLGAVGYRRRRGRYPWQRLSLPDVPGGGEDSDPDDEDGDSGQDDADDGETLDSVVPDDSDEASDDES